MTAHFCPKTPKEIIKLFGVRTTLKFLANIRSHSAGFQQDMHRHSGALLDIKACGEKARYSA
jgi:hypothetical protein